MPTYDLETAASMEINHCAYKHDWGCECWRRVPVVVEARKERIRSRLGTEPSRPLP